MCTFVTMKKSLALIDGDLTIYAEWFERHIRRRYVPNDGNSFIDFAFKHNDSIQDFMPSLKEIVNNKEVRKTIDNIKNKCGISIDILNFYLLCSYIHDLISNNFIVLLKKPTNEALEKLGEITEITFKDVDGKEVTTNYKELINVCMDATTEFLKVKGDVIEAADFGHYNKISSQVDKSILQCQFAYYLTIFLKEAFPNANRTHRGAKGLVTTHEQTLIMQLMSYFELAPKDVTLTNERYRKLKEQYERLKHFPTEFAESDYFMLPQAIIMKNNDWDKYDNWEQASPVTFVQFEDWCSGKIDWEDPELKIKELKLANKWIVLSNKK